MNTVDYKLLVEQVQAFADTENDFVPLFSNVSALLYEALEDLNWAGFYLLDKGSLLLGPFQGRTACIRIQPGRGICGTALVKDEVLRVANVHEFPGHIACDCASESEIVVPLHCGGDVVGVLDIDSPRRDRFSEEDEEGLRAVAERLSAVTDFSRLRK